MSGFFPAFQAITASTANSGAVWMRASTASASPWDMRNSAASAPQATRNAEPIMAGNVQRAVSGEPAEALPAGTAASRLARGRFIAAGYSMGRDARHRVAVESAGPRDSRASLEQHTHFLLEGEKPILEAVAAGLAPRARAPRRERPPGPPRGGGRRRARGSSRARCSSGWPTRRRRSTCSPSRGGATCPWPRSSAGRARSSFSSACRIPGNLGAVVRVAEATGCAGVVAAAGSADFFHPRAVRASAGSVLRIPVSGRVSFEPFARDARAGGPRPLRRRALRRREPVRRCLRPPPP